MQLKRSTVQERLRYYADQLRHTGSQEQKSISVMVGLEALADELDAVEQAAKLPSVPVPPPPPPPPAETDMVPWTPPKMICHMNAGFSPESFCSLCNHLGKFHVDFNCMSCQIEAIQDFLLTIGTAEYWRKQARAHGGVWPY